MRGVRPVCPSTKLSSPMVYTPDMAREGVVMATLENVAFVCRPMARVEGRSAVAVVVGAART